MAYFLREEQETLYRYDPIDKMWYLYSTYPPHIKIIDKRANNCRRVEDEDGKVILIETEVPADKIRLYK